MAEEDKSSAEAGKGEENKGAEKPAPKAPDGSEKPNISPEEQARRAEQSEKDKGSGDNKDTLREDVDYLRMRDAERARDEFINTLLSDTDKFPNVKPNDPLFKYATSKEEVEEIATDIQNRYMDVQQEALASVQTEPEKALTDEEIAAELDTLEKETNEQGKSTFGNFLNTIQRRKKA